MGKFDAYKISIISAPEGVTTFDYDLDDAFFQKIDGPEVQRGSVKAKVVLKKTANLNELTFEIAGVVKVPCDRCLDAMEQEITYKGRLFVKFGKEFSQEDDEIVIVPESEGGINIAWFLYEFIALSIPAKHVHLPGMCSKHMATKLRKHMVRKSDDDDEEGSDIDFSDVELDDEPEEETTDPRWDKLKNILDNN